MKMIKEAAQDDKFNVQLGKIQTAIEALENLKLDLPLTSQVSALERASRDLSRLADRLASQRKL